MRCKLVLRIDCDQNGLNHRQIWHAGAPIHREELRGRFRRPSAIISAHNQSKRCAHKLTFLSSTRRIKMRVNGTIP